VTTKRGKWRVVLQDTRLDPCFRVALGTYREEQEAAHAYDFALVLIGHEPVNFSPSFYADHRTNPRLVSLFNRIATLINQRKPHASPSQP